MQLGGEERIGPLRFAGLGERHAAVLGPEVDAEMRRVKGTPAAGRIDLRFGSSGKRHCEQHNAESHGCFARSRRKLSIPRAMPRA